MTDENTVSRRSVLQSGAGAAAPAALGFDIFGPDVEVLDQDGTTVQEDPEEWILGANIQGTATDAGVELSTTGESVWSTDSNGRYTTDAGVDLPELLSDRLRTPSRPATAVVHKDGDTIYADGRGAADGYSTSGTDPTRVLNDVGENIPPGGEIVLVDATFDVLNLWQDLSTSQSFTLRGVGDAALRLDSAAGDGDYMIKIQGSTQGDYSGFEFRDLELDGNAGNVDTLAGSQNELLGLGYVDDIHIENVVAHDAPNDGDGIDLDYCRDFRIESCVARNCSKGIHPSTNCSDGTIVGCKASGSGQQGLNIYDGCSDIDVMGFVSDDPWRIKGTRINISGGTCGKLTVSGAGGTDDVKISDVTVQGGKLSIYAGSGETIGQVHLSNVTSRDSPGHGVEVGGSGTLDEVKMTNVDAINPTDNGFNVTATATVVLQGPTAKNAGNYGFSLNSGTVRVLDATLDGNANGVYDGTTVFWDGAIGGGPIGGVDLSATTGTAEGDRALSSGATSNTGDNAYSYWTWDATNSVWNDGNGNTV